MERVLSLLKDSRILAAKMEYEKLLQKDPLLSASFGGLFHVIESSKPVIEATAGDSTLQEQIQQMHHRAGEVEEALTLSSSSNENWIFVTNLLGVTTHYMLDTDGSLLVRMESTQYDIPLMEQLAVVYEVALFNKWIPFCSESSLISRLSKSYRASLSSTFTSLSPLTPLRSRGSYFLFLYFSPWSFERCSGAFLWCRLLV